MLLTATAGVTYHLYTMVVVYLEYGYTDAIKVSLICIYVL